MTNNVKGKAIVDFEKIIAEIHSSGYDEGFKEGKKKGEQQYEEDVNAGSFEKICTEYVVDQFADCKTLQDFQDKLKEITLRSFNFM